jgi:hypothetical protein
VNLILTTLGVLLLLPSIVGIAFGVYMSTHPRTTTSGRLFALCWVPMVMAAAGLALRDPVTFFVGITCFLVAGAALVLGGGGRQKPNVRRKMTRGGNRRGGTSETPTRENRAAS